MGLFENFPYTNFHDLNLDWIIQKVKEAYSPDNPPPAVVFSVNGETGDVVLYTAQNVQFPDIDDSSWTLFRTAQMADQGIKFTKNQPAERVNGGLSYPIYDTGNPPPYPVTSVGGLTGAVAILNTTIVTDGGTQKLQIQFPVTTVDGQTGTVRTWGYTSSREVKLPLSTDGDIWEMLREIPSGDIGIQFEYDSVYETPVGYIYFRDENEQTTKLKILTPADIPSSSGVVSVNGANGVVVLTAANLAMGANDASTIAANIAQVMSNISANWSASSNYAAGAIVYKDKVLYEATTYNAAGTWDSQNWSSTKVGIKLTALGVDIAHVADMVAATYNPSSTYYPGAFVKKDGYLYKCVSATTGTWDSTKWTSVSLGSDLAIKVNKDVVAYPEETSVASSNYSKGQYILLNGVLHKTKTNVSLGDTWSSSNLEAVTNLGDEVYSLSNQIANINKIEDKTITNVGNYFTERDAFKARRVGNTIDFFGYVNITTEVPAATNFADIGFSAAEGNVLFTTANGSTQRLVHCTQGKLKPESGYSLPTGFYYIVGCALTLV